MKATVLAGVATAICLSACLSSGPPANQSAVGSYRITKADIPRGGGTCAGNLCTDGTGHLWDCSGGAACFRIETSGK